MDQNFQQAPEENVDNQQQGVQSAVDRFQALPMPAKLAIGGAALFFVITIFGRMGGDPAPQPQPTIQQSQNSANVRQLQQQQAAQNEGNGDDAFAALERERPALQRQFVESQSIALDELREEIRLELDSKKGELVEIQGSIESQTRQMTQMIEAFNSQMENMESSNQRTLEEISRLATENRQRDQQAPVAQGYVPGDRAPNRKGGRISQTPLAAGAQGLSADPSKALLNPIVRQGQNLAADANFLEANDSLPPFLPPLGFIRGTLLNGFDALAGGGRATPALMRLSGVYKTAMNSTVSLDGCMALLEFEGDVSTERAIGKPSRMTCVYPDHGAVTYDITGYVVDKKDGIVGVPGVFYEGDPARIASAMIADFATGLAEAVEGNQSTSTVSSDGTAQSTLTGDQTKAELAGGISKAMGSLRDYLFERANRVVPFIRVDSTRDVHIVLLSGTVLRSNGSAWSLLFDGLEKDNRDAAKRQAAQQQQNNG